MDRIISKLSPVGTITASVLGVSLVAGAFQSYMTKYMKGKSLDKYTLLLNAFTAGTQLSTVLVDLVPHISHGEEHSHGADYFHPYVLIGFTFILLLGLDHLYIQKEPTHKHHIEADKRKLEIEAKLLETINNPQNNNSVKSCCSKHTHSESSNVSHSHSHDQNIQTESQAIDQSKSEHSAGCCGGSLKKSSSFSNALLRISAISVHSFFEGFAIKPQNNTIPLVLGLLLHKFLESFNVAIALTNLEFSFYKKVLLFLFYSILTPLSICLLALFENSKISGLELWCNSLCIGALLFVVFYEIISNSFKNRSFPRMKMFLITAGYCLGCLSIIFSHSHSPASPSKCSGNHSCDGHSHDHAHGHKHDHHHDHE